VDPHPPLEKFQPQTPLFPFFFSLIRFPRENEKRSFSHYAKSPVPGLNERKDSFFKRLQNLEWMLKLPTRKKKESLSEEAAPVSPRTTNTFQDHPVLPVFSDFYDRPSVRNHGEGSSRFGDGVLSASRKKEVFPSDVLPLNFPLPTERTNPVLPLDGEKGGISVYLLVVYK